MSRSTGSAIISSASAPASMSPPARAQALVIPESYVYRRFGVSYVKLKDGTEVVVQVGLAGRGRHRDPGRAARRRRGGDAMKLGLSGFLTRAFINSPLTPLLLLAALDRRHASRSCRCRARRSRRSACRWSTSSSPPTATRRTTRSSSSPSRSRTSSRASTASSTSIRPRRTIPWSSPRASIVGTDEDTALTARAREDPRQHRRSAQGHSRADHHRPRHQRRRDRDADPGAQARGRRALGRQRALSDRPGAAARARQGRQCRPHLYRRRQPQPDPRRARSRAAGALRHHAQPARRQARPTPTARSWSAPSSSSTATFPCSPARRCRACRISGSCC